LSPDILLRALWALGIAGILLAAFWLVNKLILARNHGNQMGLESLHPGIPAILYFTTPDCAPCKTMQRPALQRLQAQLGDGLQVIEVDAAAQPNLADYWGVLSVPTTFIIDEHGEARRVNHGVASTDKLLSQINQVSGRHASFPLLRKVLLRFQSKRNYS
jgi:thiol-disulfide isomerase/thioredoxin